MFPFVTKRRPGYAPGPQSLVELVVQGGHGGGRQLLRSLVFVGEAEVTLRGAAGAAAASTAATTSAGRAAAAAAASPPLGRRVPHGAAAAVGRGGRTLLLGPPGVCRVGTAWGPQTTESTSRWWSQRER